MNSNVFKLTDVCDFQGGSQPPKEQWISIPKDGYVRMLQIRDFTQNRDEEEYVRLTNTTKLCEEDDVLIARYGASVGKILTGQAGAYNVAIMKTIPNEEVLNKRYLYYFLNTDYFQHTIQNVGSRAAQAGFNKTELEDISIYVPSMEIQERAVSVLDKVKKLVDRRKEQIEACDELIKSQFIEMFGDPIANPMKWMTKEMNEVAPVVPYKGEFEEDDIWLLNLDMVESNTGRVIKYNIVESSEIGNSTCTFNETNILYSKLRPYLNKVVIPERKGYATSELVPLQPIDGILERHYLAYMLRSNLFVDFISEKVAGAKMPRVSMQDFRKFNVPLPPIELQNEFAAFVQQVDKLKFKMEQSLCELGLCKNKSKNYTCKIN